MDGRDQDWDGGWSTVELENGRDPCALTCQPIENKLTCHIRQKSHKPFLLIAK